MKQSILLITCILGALSLSNCLFLANKSSEAMSDSDNSAVSDTGQGIQKGLAPVNKAKDDAVDAVKGAFD